MRCRIPNASGGKLQGDGGRLQWVRVRVSGDGIIIYLFEDEETMMMIILFEM